MTRRDPGVVATFCRMVMSSLMMMLVGAVPLWAAVVFLVLSAGSWLFTLPTRVWGRIHG